MSMRTNYEFRRALGRNIEIANTEEMMNSGVANCILGELDDVMRRAWSHVQDIGLTSNQFKRIKSLVKKRL
jgi:hypothetical protein